MTFNERLTSFGGLEPVVWEPGHGPLDLARQMPRLFIGFDEGDGTDDPWGNKLRAYLQLPNAHETQGIVIGTWGEDMFEVTPAKAMAALIAAAPQLPRLRVVFFGDIVMEEAEVSWIFNTSQTALYQAYPNLDHLAIRGGQDLRLADLDLPRLNTLVVETGGMSRETVTDVLAAKLPSLAHLQLYLGTSDYGATSSVDDLAPLLAGGLFPHLRYLGLQNSEYADQIAAAVATSPLLQRLEVLDLSLGVLTDDGGRALLASPGVRNLRRLDLSHHYLSPEVIAQFSELGIDVDLTDAYPPDDEYKYVAIGE